MSVIGPELGGAAAFVLAVVFAWAGAAKLVAPAATAASFSGLGLPAPRVLAIVVPTIELGLAGALVIGEPLAGFVAIGMLVAFTSLLLRAMASGRRVVCSCFGSARAEPVSIIDVARNGLLATLALAATRTDGGLPTLPALMVVTALTVLARVALGGLDRASTVSRWPGSPHG